MTGIRQRQSAWDALHETVFDVAIVGGGINGACLYRQLRDDGYRVLLLDKGDFGGGTSQASAMMVWGGLLYLRNGDLPTVGRLCAAREHMLQRLGLFVKPRPFRYLVTRHGTHSRAVLQGALYLYWLLGACRRQRPRYECDYPERAFINRARFNGALNYEEACLEPSDARFVLSWILPSAADHDGGAALNYCALAGGGYDRAAGCWRLDLEDTLGLRYGSARARCVVNAGGVWTDTVNQRFGIRTPYRHVLSKGVFIAVKRPPEHRIPVVFETNDGDHRTFTPWGPVSLYGPTETLVDNITDGFAPRREDVSFLLNEMNGCLDRSFTPQDIVSLRCGIRPVAVERGRAGGCVSQHLSRRHRLHRDPGVPWISLYGSNLTNCIPFAAAGRNLLRTMIARADPAKHCSPSVPPPFAPDREGFPGVPEFVPSARWCADHEMCCGLADYLRRRTNIAQWVARGGLGFNDENLPHLARLARVLAPDHAGAALAAYRHRVALEHDSVLAQTPATAVPAPDEASLSFSTS
ncbi:MAG: FAD-dependent oxidoreductase [Planctomycetota bacterium]|nr:FAD-dependent oxidoreductase [Planctomycetota bacterium]